MQKYDKKISGDTTKKANLYAFEDGKDCFQYIDNEGNIAKSVYSNKKHLVSGKNVYSRSYYYIEKIDEYHYIYGDIIYNGILNLSDIDKNLFQFKYGIFKLKTDKDGNILPEQEEIIVPAIFDDISLNNLNTVTVYGNSGHLSYLDINPESPNYGKLLVPIILERACPFDTTYEGFAECSIDGICGYLPRNMQSIEEISPNDLLTEDEVKILSQVINNEGFYGAFKQYLSLTGEKALTLKR